MYLDLEVQADRYEVEQELLQEMVKEHFSTLQFVFSLMSGLF